MNILNLWKKKPKDVYRLNGKNYPVEKLSFSQLMDVVFLAAPYIKHIKRIKTEYQSENTIEIFRFVIENIIPELEKETLYEIFKIITKAEIEDIKQASIVEMTMVISRMIRKNSLLDLYLLFKKLGMFDG